MNSYRRLYSQIGWALMLILSVWSNGVWDKHRADAAQNPQVTAVEGPQLSVQLGHSVMTMAVAYSSDMKLVLTGGDSGAVLWDVTSQREIRRFYSGDSGIVTSVAFSPDNKHVLTAAFDKIVRLWNVETGQEVRRFIGHAGIVRSAVFIPGQDLIATIGSEKDRTLRLWQIATGKEARRLNGEKTKIANFAVSLDGRSILTGNFDATARLFDATNL